MSKETAESKVQDVESQSQAQKVQLQQTQNQLQYTQSQYVQLQSQVSAFICVYVLYAHMYSMSICPLTPHDVSPYVHLPLYNPPIPYTHIPLCPYTTGAD
jgi:hypothetical protein